MQAQHGASRTSFAGLLLFSLKTCPTGLGSRAIWEPAQSAGRAGRRPGVEGRACSDLSSSAWGGGLGTLSPPPQVFLGGLPPSELCIVWGRHSVRLGWPNFQVLFSVLSPSSPLWQRWGGE